MGEWTGTFTMLSDTQSNSLLLCMHGYLSVCLSMISLLHNIPFQLLSNSAEALLQRPFPGESPKTVCFFLCLSLFGLFARGGTSHTGRPGWIPTQLALGPKQALGALVDIPWVPDSHLTKLQGFKPPPLPLLPTFPYIFMTTTSPRLQLNTRFSCHHHTPSVSKHTSCSSSNDFPPFWVNTSHWCLTEPICTEFFSLF